MPESKYKSIFMQFVLTMALCLCYGLAVHLWIFPARAGILSYYIVDAYRRPSVVYEIEEKRANDFFTYDSSRYGSGNIKGIAVWGRELYFCLVNGTEIYKRVGQERETVFKHERQIQDIAFDPEGNLYFSEASGSEGDGMIYKLTREKLGFSPYLQDRYAVPLNRVHGFWEGDLAFDMKGNLYLSSGNRTPAYIYRATAHGGILSEHGYPELIYEGEGAIKGIAIEPYNPDFVYYATGRTIIYRVHWPSRERSVAFSIAPREIIELSDVTFDMLR